MIVWSQTTGRGRVQEGNVLPTRSLGNQNFTIIFSNQNFDTENYDCLIEYHVHEIDENYS